MRFSRPFKARTWRWLPVSARATPAEAQLEVRLQHWYNATEQYAHQLHEVERDDYFAMKRSEYRRQQGTQ